MNLHTVTGQRIASTDLDLADGDSYTSQPVRIRIVREGDDEFPWMIDGYRIDGCTLAYTEDCGRYRTHGDAVAAIPEFIQLVRS